MAGDGRCAHPPDYLPYNSPLRQTDRDGLVLAIVGNKQLSGIDALEPRDNEALIAMPSGNDFAAQLVSFALRRVNGDNVAVVNERRHGVSLDPEGADMAGMRRPLVR